MPSIHLNSIWDLIHSEFKSCWCIWVWMLSIHLNRNLDLIYFEFRLGCCDRGVIYDVGTFWVWMLSIHLNRNWNSINFEFKLSSCHWWVIYDVGAFECWCFTSENFNALTWDHACSRHQLIIFNWGSFVQILPQAEEKKKIAFPFCILGNL